VARARRATGRIELELAAPARIVVVADSHSRMHPRALEWIRRERPAAIVHAGDIGNLEVLNELETVAPTYAVRGNVDGRDERTPDELTVEVHAGGLRLVMLTTHIGVYGPRLLKQIRLRAHELGAQLVICGHSHVPFMAQEGDVTVFNPGSLGPRRFHLPITFGVLELAEGRLALRHIDCETGTPWRPPA